MRDIFTLIGWQSVNMCKLIFPFAAKNRGEYKCVRTHLRLKEQGKNC